MPAILIAFFTLAMVFLGEKSGFALQLGLNLVSQAGGVDLGGYGLTGAVLFIAMLAVGWMLALLASSLASGLVFMFSKDSN